MKIAIAGMGHESNTFNTTLTGIEDFLLMDAAGFAARERRDSAASGMYDALSGGGAAAFPLYFAGAIPSGTVKMAAYEYIKSQIIDRLVAQAPWDGVCLALHGSMAVDGLNDPEGDLLEAIRWTVGHQVPIVCSLDMHATVTERMAVMANGYAIFRTAPHIDAYETGQRAAGIMLEIHRRGGTHLPAVSTINVLVKIPMLVSGEQSETRVDPAKSLFASLAEYDKAPGVLCASYAMGFPWADSPFGGASALVTGWADEHENLKAMAQKMAGDFWDKRTEFVFSTTAMATQDAIKAAMAATDHPVIISDSADNPTAGASQDTTTMLRLMIESGMQNALYTCVADPAAYQICTAHAIGDCFTLKFGGYFSGKKAEHYSAYVKLINTAESDGTLYAVLQSAGVIFTISNKRCATYYPQTLRDLGITPESFDIIGIKAGYLSPDFQQMSKMSILALTEGDTALQLEHLPYIKTPRPIYPLDKDMKL